MRSILYILCCLYLPAAIFAQDTPRSVGMITGNVLSASQEKSIQGASVVLLRQQDTIPLQLRVSNAEGTFLFPDLMFGWYKLSVSFTGHATLRVDSIHLRPEKPEILLTDLILQTVATGLETIVIYADKPVLEQKDGNIVFNASESPLSAGSNAAELLRTMPLVANDPDGRVTVRGREPRILIDDKPVEMNAQQMQDFLEAMPGNMIEKIEVMTNPPAQYANEPGGVINIVTRKGKTGMNGRVSIMAGTRGEANGNASFNLRKKGLSLQFNAGTGFTRFNGSGHSTRENRYVDSTNRLYTNNGFVNQALRPNFRLNVDYDLNPRNIFGFGVQFNQSDNRNTNEIVYANENRFGDIYRSSDRSILSDGLTNNPAINLSYTLKGKLKGEQLRVFGSGSFSATNSQKDFEQIYFGADKKPTGQDSAQRQVEDNRNQSMQLRLVYDKPLRPERTIFSTGFSYALNRSSVDQDSYDRDLQTNDLEYLTLLSNEFRFRQAIFSSTASLRQRLADRFWITGGLTLEDTQIYFDLVRDAKEVNNRYQNWLPFANLTRHWKSRHNLSLIYKSTIRRPGIRELNPAVDYSDPYNIRFGNPELLPSTAHNFDILFGKSNEKIQTNGGVGYNIVQDIFATVRSLNENGRTQVTWQNISGRQEFELNGWIGYTVDRKFRVNMNAAYTYNKYSAYDISKNRYRNGGSVTAKMNLSYTPNPIWNVNANLSFNRFANPQGTVRSTVNMVFGGQYKFMRKRLVAALQIVDPFFQQTYTTRTEGVNFSTESMSFTRTRNYRLTLSYNFSNAPVSMPKGQSRPQPTKGKS